METNLHDLAVLAQLKVDLNKEKYPIEYEFFGDKIIQHGEHDFSGFVFERGCEDQIELRATSLDDIKEKITKYHRTEQRNDIIDRLREDFDMSQKGAEFVIRLMVSCHSCEGAALNRIEDYLNANNYC